MARRRTVIILRNESKFQKMLTTLKPLGINPGSPVEANSKLIPRRSGFKTGTHLHMVKLQVRQTHRAWEWATIIQKGPKMVVKLQILSATHIIRIKMLKWLGSAMTGINFNKLIRLLYSKTWWWMDRCQTTGTTTAAQYKIRHTSNSPMVQLIPKDRGRDQSWGKIYQMCVVVLRLS